MNIILIFLLIFSFTPFLLWADNWKKTAIGQIPFVIGAWFTFVKYVAVGIGPNEQYLWLLFNANLVYGHIAFTIILLEMRKSMKLRRPYVQ
ncbi:spore morphogenesis/germination protein YwcE [Gracilibacillus sp. S3-1-1]|uniref:Spore morphogenesis/germination protein YwcE n=1 Tax=Gracilibacillus pellucidus TaxID=3095368 RepID=A0ACC6M0R0_9BACI|nr:spore morphogenesis/germination protein YwcE [Gracilibacillus sp. S3-1-1]MDX8044530.1 spore morphogenesis/germination protein YwcE [Gracilibacillus sp. S3-1-1]